MSQSKPPGRLLPFGLFLAAVLLMVLLAGCSSGSSSNKSSKSSTKESESYTVTFVGHDGTVLKEEAVSHGEDATAPADPERAGYTFTGWNPAYTNIVGDLTVTAQYTINTYTVTPEAGAGGGISPATAQSVNHGATTSFTVNPDEGYAIDQVSGCGGSLSNNTYTTGAITAACTVSATFVVELAPLAPLVLSAEAGDGQVTLSWNEIGADRYDLIYATDPDFDPANYSAYGGTMVVDATTPHVEVELTNGTTYYFVVEAHKDGQAVALSAKVTATPAVPLAVVQSPLNDTGITACGNYASDPPGTGDNHSNSLVCEDVGATTTVAGEDEHGNPVPAGQDVHFGRDAATLPGGPGLVKIGAGVAGFDFTKLGADGQPLAEQDTAWNAGGSEDDGSQWSCVQDNRTGLIWEVKVDDDSHLRHLGHTYSWYNEENATNGGNAGTQNGGTCSGSECDTQAFVQDVNAAGLCGANDWRLPTVQELLSVVDNGRTSTAIDLDYFPNTSSDQFWSSSPYAGHVNPAWLVSFSGGRVYYDGKGSGNRVRLVRAGQ
ncbi:DUF1566 domain-containing protein [Desulfurivibrio dismutans]|uniref:Lcl domain-containing protein n=1 Tax=Desulfurivibrio dismutans TaxID=1398908 RepID=UPI0023DAA4EC|nr:DUF1566 domain-containing protein [Desulfurivibrio alkaliphilus]MDF1614644.1 DUF1566 domain-containing protein [Desulfurivibrio alkaliphilus]